MDHGEAAIVQVRGVCFQASYFERTVCQAARPLNLIPVDFEVCTEAKFVRNSGAKDSGEIDEASLLSSGGETKIGAHHNPPAVWAWNLKAQRMRLLVTALGYGHVNR